ncbi:MAG: lysophospholipid acyltransferase family protein [Hyphomicrobiales bacterium]
MSEVSEPVIPPRSGSTPTIRAAARRLRYRVEYGFFWCIAKLAAALPLELCAAWSGWCWRQMGRFNSRRQRAHVQLARSLPELSDAERETIVSEMWDNLGRAFAETFHLREFIDHPERYEMTREAELREFMARSRRFIIVSLHSANWELAALGPLRAGLRIAGIYQAIKNPFVDAYVTRLREPLYPAALLPKSRDTPRRFIKLMREGVTVAMMSDLRETRGIEVPFFGRPAPSTSFPALLSVAHELPILAVRTLRLPRSHFQFDWRVLEPVRDGASREDNVRATTAMIQNCFESWVRERPGEWMWVHRRWG